MYEDLQRATAVIAQRSGRPRHAVAAVLGSGLGAYAPTVPGGIAIPYGDIPGFPVPRVEGHAGTLYSAELEGVPVLLLAGRAHAYEGYRMSDVVFGVRTAVAAGAQSVLLTNAAGGVNPAFSPGDLVLITDHLNLTGRNPLDGANDDRLGPRFPDMSEVYSTELRRRARQAAAEVDVALGEGTYAWLLGPSYETPAEIRMVATLGADLVGMSTVPEAIALRHMGARVLGISLVTNLAAGISDQPLSHDEVQEAATAARDRFSRLVSALLPRLAG